VTRYRRAATVLMQSQALVVSGCAECHYAVANTCNTP